MSDSEEDFGDIDDDAMMLAATQAEQDVLSQLDSQSGRASKRRRLNNPSGDDFLDPASIEEEDLFVSGSEAENSHDADHSNVADGKTHPGEKQKSKYRIHVPKNADLPEDSFHTQVPRSSQSPYRIRGCLWPKRRSPSPTLVAASQVAAAVTKKNSKETVGDSSKVTHPGMIRPAHGTEDQLHNGVQTYCNELADLPSDAFSSSPIVANEHSEPIEISSQQEYMGQWQSQTTVPQRLVGPQANLRQTTLFGGQAQASASASQSASQSTRRHNWPAARRDEPPTHHKLEKEALQTWVYPTNLGTIRDYQFNLVARGLYHNLLVALPTGLGKTFIAATIMLNWFRWTKDAQIVFVAPTKPLVSQQVKACFNITGIPRSETTLLTGNTAPGIRAEEWKSKRVFFMTPQTILNDLKVGICDPKNLVLLVVDEAHRATGSYAYVEVVKFVRRFNTSFRVLALTATPGSSIESVQEVIDGLGISRIEIRTEESLDIRQHVHPRRIDTVLFENSDEIVLVMELFSKALQPIVNKLAGMCKIWNRDPMSLTPYGCTQARQQWMASDAGRKAHFGVKGMVNSMFTILASLAHSIELLKYHGMGPFYQKLVHFRSETQADSNKGSKYRRQVIEDENFKKMMSTVQGWLNDRNFIGHPKLEYLQSVILKHFVDASEGRSEDTQISSAHTRIMVFAHFRDSAEEIARILKRNDPIIRPHVFVGQASAKGSEGMGQKMQLEIIDKFKTGIYNTLVATSVGEEGLDIGEVDLIICYDSSASPIRTLQRMGRTGRKRAGNIVVTLMKGKEEANFTKSREGYEKMQSMIAAATRFTFRDDLSTRIVPKDIQPVVDKRIVEIPFENTQGDLPEPKKRGRPPKRPPKKFHMPDNVLTGFTKASRLKDGEEDPQGIDYPAPYSPQRTPSPQPVPPLESVLLTAEEEKFLDHAYQDIGSCEPQAIEALRLGLFPKIQRTLRRTRFINHGRITKRVVKALNAIHEIPDNATERYEHHLDPEDKQMIDAQARKEMAAPGPAGPLEGPIFGSIPPDSPGPASGRELAETNTDSHPTFNDEIYDDDRNDAEMTEFFHDDASLASPMKAASSVSTPPSFEPDGAHFNLSPKKAILRDEGSDDDLPDVNSLIEGPPRQGSPEVAQTMQTPDRRRGRRRVVEEDSDEE